MDPYRQDRLSVHDLYPQQMIKGLELSPGGEWFSFLYQRELKVEKSLEDGQEVFARKPIADICLMSLQGSYRQPLTNSGDIIKPPMWSPDGKALVFQRKEALQIMRLDAGSSDKPVRAFDTNTIYRGKLYGYDLKSGDEYFSNPSWRPPDGDFILFATREYPRTTLRVVSTDGHLQRELYSVKGYIISWNWSPDGRKIVAVTCCENGSEGKIHILDFDTGEAQTDWVQSESHYRYRMPVAAWTPDGSHVVFRSNRSGWAKLWIAALDNPEAYALTTGAWDDYGFRFSPDGNYLIYASGQDQKVSGDDLWIVPLTGGEPNRVTQHCGVNVPLVWSNEDRFFYWHSSPVEPGDLWSAALNGEGRVRHTFSASVELEQKLSAPREEIIRNKDGTEIRTLIYTPTHYRENEQQLPAVIWIRGGPTGVNRYDFAPLYNWLANEGFVVVTPNYRGSVGNGVEHMLAVTGEGVGKNDLSDIFAVRDYVISQSYVDTTRGVGIGGHSWGGYLTLRAITEFPEGFSCAVAGAAISDWLIQQAETEVRSYDYWLIGNWVYIEQFLAKERSPVNFVERIKIPLFIYHGEKDKDVPFAQFNPFLERALKANVRVEKKVYPAEPHNIIDWSNGQNRLDSIREFFRRHLCQWDFTEIPGGGQVL